MIGVGGGGAGQGSGDKGKAEGGVHDGSDSGLARDITPMPGL